MTDETGTVACKAPAGAGKARNCVAPPSAPVARTAAVGPSAIKGCIVLGIT